MIFFKRHLYLLLLSFSPPPRRKKKAACCVLRAAGNSLAGGILAVPHFALPNTGLCRSPYRCPCFPHLLFAAFVCLLVHCCTPSEMTLKLYVNVSRQANCNLLTISAASARTDSEARLWPASATLHTSPSLHGPRTCRVPTELVTVTACTFFFKKNVQIVGSFFIMYIYISICTSCNWTAPYLLCAHSIHSNGWARQEANEEEETTATFATLVYYTSH